MARPSEIYRSQQQSSQVKNKYKFPVLDSQELVLLYDTMGFDISESSITRPNYSFMKSLIEQILDKFLYISPHSLKDKVARVEMNYSDSDNEERTENDKNDKNGDFGLQPSLNQRNGNNFKYDIKSSISIVACQRIMYRFLCDCGVDDFSIRDISKPESSRLKIILSALINYARFREERMGDLDELMDKNDQTLDNYKLLLKKIKKQKSRLGESQRV